MPSTPSPSTASTTPSSLHAVACSPPGVADGLVVDRVDLRRPGQDRFGDRSRLRFDRVHRLVLANLFPVVLEARRGQVLVQRAAERDREHLCAPADAEDAPAGVAGDAHARDLGAVAGGIDAHEGIGRALAVGGRIDVAASAHQERVRARDRVERARRRPRSHPPRAAPGARPPRAARRRSRGGSSSARRARGRRGRQRSACGRRGVRS